MWATYVSDSLTKCSPTPRQNVTKDKEPVAIAGPGLSFDDNDGPGTRFRAAAGPTRRHRALVPPFTTKEAGTRVDSHDGIDDVCRCVFSLLLTLSLVALPWFPARVAAIIYAGSRPNTTTLQVAATPPSPLALDCPLRPPTPAPIQSLPSSPSTPPEPGNLHPRSSMANTIRPVLMSAKTSGQVWSEARYQAHVRRLRTPITAAAP
ncbi:hypothetical protein CGMCC3_g5488 [Colletotrichum fructicola]|nr:uncharacterized protein CGMCC3_g5488 [Colletotrichum fructicola]KAE9578404.1 hypothetical protein CGMCC3_g5488 [Colletotrichum fructicola]